MPIEVLTLGEFMERWEQSDTLMAPCDFPHVGNPDELGIIVDGTFQSITFSPDAKVLLSLK